MPIAHVKLNNNYQLSTILLSVSQDCQDLLRNFPDIVFYGGSLSANDYLLSVSTVTVIAVCPSHPGQVLHGCNFLE